MYPQYMCILLYMKHIWCNGIPYIYCQLEWGVRCILSIYTFCYMWHLFGVMVFHRSIVNWSAAGGYMYPQYMCILPYVKLIWCNSIPYILSIGVRGYMYHQYMCILLYVKLIWCNVIQYIYCQLVWVWEDVSSVYVHSADMCN